MKHIHYIGFYSKPDNPQNFRSFPSVNTKMDYIISALKNADFKLTLFALGKTISKNKFYNSKSFEIDEKEKIKYVSTFGNAFPGLKFLSRLWLLLQLLNYLLFVVEKNGCVLFYHTHATMSIIKIARVFKKFNLILEVEEIFQAAWRGSDEKIQKEIKYIQIADAYIVVNDIMAQKCNLEKKPSAVCYGDYRVKGSSIILPINEENINLVYAGVLGGLNSDVFLAIETLLYLPKQYKLHVLGYGSAQDILDVNNKISEVNKIIGKEQIKFHGKLLGKEYLDFLATCQVGLSTRVLEDNYSDYTFPSKVLVYLGNNLATVSSSINCIMKSKVADLIYFCDSPQPESVAKAILSIDLKKLQELNQIDTLKKLDKDFTAQIGNIINNLK